VRSEAISGRGVQKIVVRDFKVSAEMKYFQNEVYISQIIFYCLFLGFIVWCEVKQFQGAVYGSEAERTVHKT
jgi:hypothetical protein